MEKPEPTYLVQHDSPNRAQRRAEDREVARRRRRGQRAFDRRKKS